MEDNLIVDKENPQGDLSAHTGPGEWKLNHRAMWHIVSETVFYYDKLHLTEKIFKPIVSHRPFILVAAQGNLAYLKSYGFKTFERWIDESYDNESDPDKRISMIVAEVEKLCSMSMSELETMYEEMKETLEFNFNHFYNGDFKNIIVDEMLDNFKQCAEQRNQTHSGGLGLNVDNIDFAAVKKRLTS
jgi:hypothetical protein